MVKAGPVHLGRTPINLNNVGTRAHPCSEVPPREKRRRERHVDPRKWVAGEIRREIRHVVSSGGFYAQLSTKGRERRWDKSSIWRRPQRTECRLGFRFAAVGLMRERSRARLEAVSSLWCACVRYRQLHVLLKCILQYLSLFKSRETLSSHLSQPRGSLGHHRWFRNQFPPFSPVLHCRLGLGELQICPFPDVVFPSLPVCQRDWVREIPPTISM